MEENKYYIPDISEFCMGFTFYKKTENEKYLQHPSDLIGWSYTEYNILVPLIKIKELIQTSEIRVKYLDKEDLIELGWEFRGREECEGSNHVYNLYSTTEFDEPMMGMKPHHKELFILSYYPHNNNLTISDCKTNNDIFNGFIKNKSELARLIKQLKIK